MASVILLFILGAIVGSFLNVVGLRWRSGVGLGGRSFCVSCHKTLRWYELVPLVSFIGLGGKCRGCKEKISWQYPVVEFLTGIVFVSIFDFQASIFGTYNWLFFVTTMLLLAAWSIMVVIVIYDSRHKIIPDELVYAALLLGIIYRFLMGGSALDWSAGIIVFCFFAAIWLLTKGKAMGFGDAKLGAAIGFILGAVHSFSAVVLAFWIGAIVSIFYMVLQKTSLLKGAKRLTMKSEIAFAPYLVLGAWASMIFALDLLHVAFL